MKLIAPSILSADFKELSNQIRYTEIGGADIIHCDIMDGSFVPNITFGPLIVESVKRSTKLPIDCHLMIDNPQKFIESFVKAGADYISIHQENVIHLHRVIQQIKNHGVKAGVVLNPSTPVDTLNCVLDEIDFVLIMSVNPGFEGQKFINSSLEKIIKLNKIREEKSLNFLIEIDGGVNKDNIKNISDLGCDIFVAGSAIFHSDNISAATAELKNLITT